MSSCTCDFGVILGPAVMAAGFLRSIQARADGNRRRGDDGTTRDVLDILSAGWRAASRSCSSSPTGPTSCMLLSRDCERWWRGSSSKSFTDRTERACRGGPYGASECGPRRGPDGRGRTPYVETTGYRIERGSRFRWPDR